VNSYVFVFDNRSHDDYVTGKDGFLQPAAGSNYASQQTVFDDLGQGVLHNAFDGNYNILRLSGSGSLLIRDGRFG